MSLYNFLLYVVLRKKKRKPFSLEGVPLLLLFIIVVHYLSEIFHEYFCVAAFP